MKLGYLFWMGLGLLCAALRLGWLEYHHHSLQVTGLQLIHGYVSDLPILAPHHLVFALTSLEYGQLRLNWYGPRPFLMPGQGWQLLVRFKSPDSAQHRLPFDYARYLQHQGFAGTASVVTSRENHRLYRQDVRVWVAEIRDRVRIRLLKVLPHGQMRAVLLALAIGDRSFVTPEIWQVLQRTGTSHLIAISGLHVGLFAWIAYVLVRYPWSLSIRLCHFLPAQRVGALMGFLVAFLYSLLAGFAIPTERALIMIGFASYCAFRGRQPHSFRAWILAFVVILILQPYAVFSISFWLSFVAVLALIYVLSHRVGAILGWAKWLWPQWAIFCLLAPMTIFTFGMISITSLQANLWAIPLISFCVVPFVFLGLGFLWIPALAHLCFEIGNAFVSLWWWGLKTSAKPEWAAFVIHAPSLWATVLAELGILWLIAPRAIPARYLGAVYCLPFMLQAAQIWGHP